MARRFCPVALLILAASLAVAAQSRPDAAGEAAALRARAFDLAYNLDHPEAVVLLDRALALAPSEPATHRAIASITWLSIIFRRGSITVDHYMGSMTRPEVKLEPPPADQAALFQKHATEALRLAEQAIARRPRDVGALYDLGTAVGVQASYHASVDGKLMAAFRAARRAYDAHETILEIQSSRHDAGLIVGTYRYIVSTLSFPLRLMAYVVGFGGDGARGLRMIELAARYPGDSQVEAQFALLILYNRERRFDDALRTIGELQQRFPRNRILWLEHGATALRARRFETAERSLSDGIARLAADNRPRAAGEEAMWYYKRGAARVGLRRPADAESDLRRALSLAARDWVHARVRLELGKLADVAGDRARARQEYAAAIRLAESGGDPETASEARKLTTRAYR